MIRNILVVFCFFFAASCVSVPTVAEIPCPLCEAPVRWGVEQCRNCGVEALTPLPLETVRERIDAAFEDAVNHPKPSGWMVAATSLEEKTPSWVSDRGGRLRVATGKNFSVGISDLWKSEADARREAEERAGGYSLQWHTVVSCGQRGHDVFSTYYQCWVLAEAPR